MTRKKAIKVKGLDKVLKTFNKKVDFTNDNVRKGLQAAGLFIKAESKENAPHDTGLLINSHFFSTAKIGKKWLLRIGSTAEYAPIVHEMPETNNFSKPGTGPKFLFNAVFDNVRKIIEIIRARSKF